MLCVQLDFQFSPAQIWATVKGNNFWVTSNGNWWATDIKLRSPYCMAKEWSPSYPICRHKRLTATTAEQSVPEESSKVSFPLSKLALCVQPGSSAKALTRIQEGLNLTCIPVTSSPAASVGWEVRFQQYKQGRIFQEFCQNNHHKLWAPQEPKMFLFSSPGHVCYI